MSVWNNCGDQRWVLVKLDDETYGIPAEIVKEMLLVPVVTRVPRMPPHVRGVINLRGAVMPLIDLKVRLGSRSSLDEMEELIQNLHARERDHRNWLVNLEDSVREHKPFTGQLDPHKCAFGIWYDSYVTENAFLKRVLRQFDKPHKHIHKIGERVKELEEREDFESAIKLIKDTRDKELAVLIELFEEARQTLWEYLREVAVVLESGGMRLAFTVDHAVSVEKLDAASFEDLKMGGFNAEDESLISSTARQIGSDSLIMLLDAHRIIEEISGTMRDMN